MEKIMDTTQTPSTPPVPDVLLSLASTNLQVQRQDRYDGGGFGVSLSKFAPEDVSIIIQLYNAVKRTYELWLYMKDAPNYDLMKKQLLSQFASDSFLSSTQSIGVATRSMETMTPLLRKVTHDVRGGALAVLTGYSTMMRAMDLGDDTETYIENAVLMARDHAKLMRNAIVDLDPIVRQADESLKIHTIDDFVKKWHNGTINIADKSVSVTVNCTFEGSITNRCLETSAIDRILYNYINNAARFTTDARVVLTIFAINDSLVRWIVENGISAEQETWLAEKTGNDLQKLFRGGLTRGGHGIGLSGCADFVASSFGVLPEDALELDYLGAKVIDSRYYAWFHWPIYQHSPDDTTPVCECDD